MVLNCTATQVAGEPLCAETEPAVPPAEPCAGLVDTADDVGYAQSTWPEGAIPGRFIVEITPARDATTDALASTPKDLETFLRSRFGARELTVTALPLPRTFEVTWSDLRTRDASIDVIQRMMQARYDRADPRSRVFNAVEPVFLMRGAAEPNDDEFYRQWGLSKIAAPDAWNLLRADDHEVSVAVVDSGVWYNPDHAGPSTYWYGDLEGRLWSDSALPGPNGAYGSGAGANWIASPANGDSYDAAGHGTRVAGIIGAATDNDHKGIAGTVGPTQLVELVPVKVLQPADDPRIVEGTTTDIIEGIDYAVNAGARVVNLSLGSTGVSTALCRAIELAGEKDVLVVAAAGNAGLSNDLSLPFYPASFALDNILAVMATDHDDEVIDQSNVGCKTVDIAAPGIDIVSTSVGDQYVSDLGTSMAAPFVSGAAALVRSMNPAWSAPTVRRHLMDTADPAQAMNASNGRLNLRNALSAPLRIRRSRLPRTWKVGANVTVKWSEVRPSRACPTAYVRLLPAGAIPTHDDCSNTATCLSLASAVPSSAGHASVVLPGQPTTNARLRVGCDGSGLYDEFGPFSIGT